MLDAMIEILSQFDAAVPLSQQSTITKYLQRYFDNFPEYATRELTSDHRLKAFLENGNCPTLEPVSVYTAQLRADNVFVSLTCNVSLFDEYSLRKKNNFLIVYHSLSLYNYTSKIGSEITELKHITDLNLCPLFYYRVLDYFEARRTFRVLCKP